MADQQTIETYNNNAKEFAKYFSGIGPRIKDIENALRLANAEKDARVVEIGCGDGRDSLEITKRVGWYEGFDPSTEFIKIARTKNPEASFVKADALSYLYPKNLDVIFAFASLLHVGKEDMREVFVKASESLKPNGIFFISYKELPEYTEFAKKDNYGTRTFYFYNLETIKNLYKGLFELVYESHKTLGDSDWFEVALSKI